MPTAPTDLAEFALGVLKADEAVTALVVDGATGIMETGDIGSRTLEQAQTARREGGNPPKVLGITVMDAGERATSEQFTVQRVGIWIFDRERGYANIRRATKAIYGALEGKSTPLSSPITGRTAAVMLQFDVRTGHLIQRSLEVDLEYIEFLANIQKDPG